MNAQMIVCALGNAWLLLWYIRVKNVNICLKILEKKFNRDTFS